MVYINDINAKLVYKVFLPNGEVNKMKIITICGSLKFEADIKKWAEKLTLEGNCVLSIIYPVTAGVETYTSEQRESFAKTHRKRVDLSDAIFVVNKGGYIGNSTQNEIEYAKAHGKEIIFLEN